MKRLIALISALIFCIVPLSVDAVSDSAKASVVINGENGEIIYSKNADARLSMASTTKIMTGLLLCEYGNFDKEITVSADMLRVEGSSMGLLPGDRVTLHDLLYGLMLASGNDAANVIATVVGGSVDGFVKLMNNRARAMGLQNTSFATPSGLDTETHYTTAYELAIIAMHAMENEAFAKAVSTKKATLNYGNPPYRRTLTNHNKLLDMMNGAVGIKTGFTKKSGRCLVSAVEGDGKLVITVTLNDPNDWQDHIALAKHGLSLIKQVQFTPENKEYKIPVINGESNYLNVELNSFFVNTVDTSGIEFQVNLPEFLYAPIKKGEEIGSVVYSRNGAVLGEKKITAAKDICEAEIKTDFWQKLFNKVNLIIDNI